MKKLFFTLLTLCFCGATYAYDFSATVTNDDGTEVTLYYKILTDVEGNQVEVTYGTEEAPNGSTVTNEYSGEITIPSTVSYQAEGEGEATEYTVVGVGNSAFYFSSITKLTIPESVEYLDYDACWACISLTDVTILGPASLGYGAFGNCSNLANVTMSGNVPSIGTYAFAFCHALTEIIIPASVTSYGVDAFNECTNLKIVVLLDSDPSDVTFNGTAGESNDVFYNDSGITFYVPQGSEGAYLASVWEDEVETDNDSWNFFSIDIAETYTDGTNYYATYYMDEADYELSDVTLYAVTDAEDGEATMEALTGAIIPSGTPLLIESSVAGTNYFWKDYYGADGTQAGYLSGITPTTISVPENNMLYGHSEQAYTCAANGDYDASKVDGYLYYKLSLKSSSDPTSVGFYYGAANGASYQASAHKCWLAVPSDSSSADGISLKKGDSDDTTGISSIESASEKAVSGIYTIQGVRVSNMNQPGLYIVDGKKVLVK